MTPEELAGEDGWANYIRDNCGSTPAIEEIIRLARRGLRAEAETCATCGNYLTYGGMMGGMLFCRRWSNVSEGRMESPPQNGYCYHWKAG